MTQLGTLLLDASQVRTKNHNLISFHGHPQVLIKKFIANLHIRNKSRTSQSFSSAAVMQCMTCHCSLAQRAITAFKAYTKLKVIRMWTMGGAFSSRGCSTMVS